MKLSKKKIISFVAGVLALLAVVGSWAYFTSTSSIDNKMQTLAYGSRTIEEFPVKDLEPGAEIKKTVNVVNTGDYDLLIRIKFDEKWERSGAAFKTILFNSKIDTAAYTAGPPEAWTATQVNATDGLVPTDNDTEQTVIYKKLNAGTGAGMNWVKGSDGYFYYKVKLEAGQRTTTNLLDSIRLASNADMGKYLTKDYYSTVDPATITPTSPDSAYNWVEGTTAPAGQKITFKKSDTTLDTTAMGYAKADYTLTVTTEVLQATKEAVDATWTMTAADLAAIKAAWNLT